MKNKPLKHYKRKKFFLPVLYTEIAPGWRNVRAGVVCLHSLIQYGCYMVFDAYRRIAGACSMSA